MSKILHINSNYLTSRLHENLMDRLEASGDFDNTIFMPMKEEKKAEILYESSYRVHNPVAFKDLDKFFFRYKQSKIYKKLKETVSIENFDMVHAHTLFTDGNVALRIKKEYGIPYIVAVRGYTDINSFFKKRIDLRARGREILNQASRIIFLSQKNRDELLDTYIKDPQMRKSLEKKIDILPNGIDDIYFEKEHQAKELPTDQALKFIEVGKVAKIKNQMSSMKAIHIFEQKYHRETEFNIVGKVIDSSYAREIQAKQLGTVNFHDPVPPEKLIDLLREQHIFIMPSYYETFGLVYPEAMSQGLPVIYSKDQGFDGQFQEGHVGYRVDPHDPLDIAENINKIVENYSELSQNAIQAYKKFSWDSLAEDYVAIYKSII
ncbi:MAG: glycosyltransferase family 4 protein [Atopococcus tabaci]|uniref:Glycosyltransferase family 4 protein n=1 Tax=Atopococcus tabaci TaxID=269774 RepID=A0AA43RL56_9LACT|nr:glycosyltransferase family 4 protein [Atopococcus tabaci]